MIPARDIEIDGHIVRLSVSDGGGDHVTLVYCRVEGHRRILATIDLTIQGAKDLQNWLADWLGDE